MVMEKKDNFIKRYNYVIKMIIEFGTITRVITEQNNIMKEQ